LTNDVGPVKIKQIVKSRVVVACRLWDKLRLDLCLLVCEFIEPRAWYSTSSIQRTHVIGEAEIGCRRDMIPLRRPCHCKIPLAIFFLI
jgi:hypothetical protein